MIRLWIIASFLLIGCGDPLNGVSSFEGGGGADNPILNMKLSMLTYSAHSNVHRVFTQPKAHLIVPVSTSSNWQIHLSVKSLDSEESNYGHHDGGALWSFPFIEELEPGPGSPSLGGISHPVCSEYTNQYNLNFTRCLTFLQGKFKVENYELESLITDGKGQPLEVSITFHYEGGIDPGSPIRSPIETLRELDQYPSPAGNNVGERPRSTQPTLDY